MDVRIETDAVDELLAADARLVLYRIVQEAVSNALRHSKTDVVRIQVVVEGDRVVGLVRDEGKGFGPADVDRRGAGLGLLSMQERAAMVGGRLSIESAPGEGTTVRVELPAVLPQRS